MIELILTKKRRNDDVIKSNKNVFTHRNSQQCQAILFRIWNMRIGIDNDITFKQITFRNRYKVAVESPS